MLPTLTVWGVAVDLELVLLLAYVFVLWAIGWALEILARAHSHRAQTSAHNEFAYDSELDRYEWPRGESLTLHTFYGRSTLAIDKAPASSCNGCVLKAFRTPHDEGRRVNRSLAEFHETDIGRFHRRLSRIVRGLALAFSAVGLAAWWGKPGEWLPGMATGISLLVLWCDDRDCNRADRLLHRSAAQSGNAGDPNTNRALRARANPFGHRLRHRFTDGAVLRDQRLADAGQIGFRPVAVADDAELDVIGAAGHVRESRREQTAAARFRDGNCHLPFAQH